MGWLFWDASALVKRYTPEVGRDTVNALFHNLPAPAMATSPWGYLETYAIYVLALPNRGVDCALIASDRRLLRAAATEGLATLNPETVPAADVPAFLARL
jgi:predicted nucleic acid-binding protein